MKVGDMFDEKEETTMLRSVEAEVENECSSEMRDVKENLVSLEIEQDIEAVSTEVTLTTTVEIEGRVKHKAPVIRVIFYAKSDKGSTDRRVRAFKNFPDSNDVNISVNISDDICMLDKMVMIGDTVCGKVLLKSGKACFAVAKIISIRDTTSKRFLTAAAIANIGDLQFRVKIYHARIGEEKLKFLHTSSGLLTWNGSQCISLQLTDMKLPVFKAIELFQSLPNVDNQQIDFATCLPYHEFLAISIYPDIGKNGGENLTGTKVSRPAKIRNLLKFSRFLGRRTHRQSSGENSSGPK